MARNRGWKIARLGLMTIALVMALSFVCHAATVTGMAVKKADDKVEIHLNANGPVYYRVISRSKPRQALVVEMQPASVLKNVQKTIQIDKGIIERAKIERNKPGKASLVVEVLHPVKYFIKAAPGNRGFVLVVGTQTIAAKESKAVPSKEIGQPTMTDPSPMEPPKAVAKKKAYHHKNLHAKKKKKRVKPVKLVSIDFVNADLIYVLKLLAKELDVNLVTDSTVTGSVTMSLKNVSAQTAMNIIIKMNGFQQKKMGTILFVGSQETMDAITPEVIDWDPSNVVVKAIKLEHMMPGEAVSTITGSFPLVKAMPGRGAVIVHAPEKMMLEIENLVKSQDVPKTEQPVAVVPEAKVEIVKLNYANAGDTISMVKQLLGEGNTPEVMDTDKRLNAIIMKGEESVISAAKRQIEELDKPLPQVMLAIKVIDLSETGAANIGLNWTFGSQDGTQPIKWYEIDAQYPNSTQFTQAGANPYNPYTDGPATYGGVPIGFFIRDPFVMTSSIAMQITQGNARVLASPRVATMSGKSATIHIGDKYPIVYYDPRAGQYQVIYVDIGIKLTVKPTISANGYITTEINTTVSDLRELINNQYPRTTERSAELTIRVKDNNTIVIGGMINEAERTNISKVPLLGDVPVIGHLFRSKTTDKSKGEVVLMVTPKIIQDN